MKIQVPMVFYKNGYKANYTIIVYKNVAEVTVNSANYGVL